MRRPLVEVVLSLAVVLVGLVAMFRVLAVGTSSTWRLTERELRAQALLEAIRRAPPDALDCLAATPADGWVVCEARCRAALGAAASPEACRYADEARRGSFVQKIGRVYDAQITVGGSVTLRTGVFR
jgi:hypothetical protein